MTPQWKINATPTTGTKTVAIVQFRSSDRGRTSPAQRYEVDSIHPAAFHAALRIVANAYSQSLPYCPRVTIDTSNPLYDENLTNFSTGTWNE